MKTTILAVVLLGLGLIVTDSHAGGTLACGGSVTAMRDGKKIDNIPRSVEMINDLQALLQSCSVDTSANASEKKWNELLKSASYIYFSLPTEFVFRLPLQADIHANVTEIILPLPDEAWPDNIYVKNKDGYFSYCKYRPDFLRKIIEYPEINLLSKAPYDSLAAWKETK